MADARKSLLGELAADAALERQDFLVQAAEQLQRFLDANRARLEEIGGITLIDEDPDYLSIAPDLSFRSRARYLDGETGEWQSETEVIESAGELIELYNPADIYQAFAEAAREAAGMAPEPTATDDLMDVAGISPAETVAEGAAYAEAADAWAQRQAEPPTDADGAARLLYDLALEYQERSQRSEADLLEQFERAALPGASILGDLIVVDDDDERLVLREDGSLRAEVIPEDAEGEWRSLTGPEDLVEFYDPTDVFGDIADAIAEGWPEVAPEFGDGSEDDDGERDGSA